MSCLVIDETSVYELDEDCMREKKREKEETEEVQKAEEKAPSGRVRKQKK